MSLVRHCIVRRNRIREPYLDSVFSFCYKPGQVELEWPGEPDANRPAIYKHFCSHKNLTQVEHDLSV